MPFTILQPHLDADLLCVRALNLTPGSELIPAGAVALMYDSKVYGRVVVMETRTDVTREMFDQSLDTMSDPLPPGAISRGTAEEVIARDQRSVIQIGPEGNTALVLFERGFETTILGPLLKKNDLLAIAEGMTY